MDHVTLWDEAPMICVQIKLSLIGVSSKLFCVNLTIITIAEMNLQHLFRISAQSNTRRRHRDFHSL